jgi:hypothetical protein
LTGQNKTVLLTWLKQASSSFGRHKEDLNKLWYT